MVVRARATWDLADTPSRAAKLAQVGGRFSFIRTHILSSTRRVAVQRIPDGLSIQWGAERSLGTRQ